MPYKEQHFTKPKELLELVRRSSLQNEHGSRFIFRGEPDGTSYPLTPSAWRTDDKTKKLFKNTKLFIEKKYYNFSNNDINIVLLNKIKQITTEKNIVRKILSHVWQVTCEIYLVHEFTRRSNIIGLKINRLNPFGKLEDAEDMDRLLEEILSGSAPSGLLGDIFVEENKAKLKTINEDTFDITSYSLNYFKQSFFPCFVLAQHHGIPTRLLDWTRDPLKALFFAADSIKNKKNIPRICLWLLPTHILKERYGCSVRMTDDFPHHEFQFLHKQEGVFTYTPFADGWFLKHGHWCSIEDGLETSAPSSCLFKFTLDIKHVKELLRLLAIEGITKESLMPTYNHVAESIKNDRGIF